MSRSCATASSSRRVPRQVSAPALAHHPAPRLPRRLGPPAKRPEASEVLIKRLRERPAPTWGDLKSALAKAGFASSSISSAMTQVRRQYELERMGTEGKRDGV